MIDRPPSFLTGSSAPHPRNNEKRYKLYRKFWQLLDNLGEWNNPDYLRKKRRKTIEDDPREILPKCVVQVSTKDTSVYIITSPSTQEIRRRYPNPEGVPYTDYVSTFSLDI